MSYLNELADFVVLHARSQQVPAALTRDVLSRVRHDGAGSGSWVGEWSAAAAVAAARGECQRAVGLYGLARFPFVDGPDRQAALAGCVAAFESWRATHPGIERRTVTLEGAPISYYLSGPGGSARPLLVVLGGIVSLKEQWAQFLGLSRRLNIVVAVTEMPGVGENGMRYTPSSWSMLTALLDDLALDADVENTFVLGMSFGGHLALHCALRDRRIREVATVGAPVHDFFDPTRWWPRVPETTRRTLAHTTGIPVAELTARLPEWALADADLTRLDIPVHYVASSRDEVVPAADVALLRRHVRRAHTITFDDVHGSPHHLLQMRAWLALAVLEWRGDGAMQRLALRTFLRVYPGRRVRSVAT